MKVHPLFPYLLQKHLAIPTSPFFHLLVNGFCVITILIIFSSASLDVFFSECTEAITTSLIPLGTISNVLLSLVLAVLCGLK